MLTWYLIKLFQWLEWLLGVNEDWVEWYFSLTYQFWFRAIPNFMIKIKEVDQFWFRNREQWLSKQLELFNDCIMRNIGTTIVSWKHIWQKELVHVTYKIGLEGELQLTIDSQHMTIQIGANRYLTSKKVVIFWIDEKLRTILCVGRGGDEMPLCLFLVLSCRWASPTS